MNIVTPAGALDMVDLAEDTATVRPARGSWILVGLAWVAVGVPLLWGIWTTLKKAIVLFR